MLTKGRRWSRTVLVAVVVQIVAAELLEAYGLPARDACLAGHALAGAYMGWRMF